MNYHKLPRGAIFELQKMDFGRGIALFAFVPDKGYVVRKDDGSFEVLAESFIEVPPLLVLNGLDMKALQSLADELFKMGIMPSTTDNKNELAATKAHLADMRDLALKSFNKLLEQQ